MKNNRIRFLRGSIATYLNMFTSIIINILLVRIMLNGLGKNSYGLWVTISSIFGFMVLSDLGIGQSATKLIAEKEDQFAKDDFINKELVSTTFFTNLFIGLLILIINSIVSMYIYKILNVDFNNRQSIGYLYILLSINFFITFVFSTFRNVLVGYKYISTNNYLNIAKNVLNFILIYVVLKLSSSLYYVAIIQVILALLFGVFTICALKMHKITIVIKFKYFSNETFKKIFKPGLYYLILQIAGVIGGNTDNLILNYFISPSIVALYSSGYKLASTSMQLVFAIVDNLFPFISELDAKNNTEKLKKIFMISEKFSLYVGIFIAFTFIIFGKPIMEIWLGKENYIGHIAMVVFAIFVLLNIINHVPIVFLQGMNKHAILAKLSILEAIVNVILSLIFVKTVGAYGAILGTVVADIFILFWYSTYSLLKVIKINFKEYFSILKPSIFLVGFMILSNIFIDIFNIQLIPELKYFLMQYSLFIIIVIVFSFLIGMLPIKTLKKKLFHS